MPEELRARITAAAAGNPLFISEMLAMAQQAGDDIEVPASLKALLAARLDQLDPAERRVLECGSVEGEVFHRGAVQALTPEETQVTPRLAALVRRELIRSDRPQFAGEDGFRFRHLLIRDTAYDALPKTTRAELHQRFAAWLDQHGQSLVERDEIVGYHLEQAARYKHELGQPDSSLAERAGERLAAAGRSALWRLDERAAAGLIERALGLTRPARLDVVLELDLGQALSGSNPQAAAMLADAAAERARAAGDETGEALARLGAAYFRVFFEDDPAIDEVETLVRAALPCSKKPRTTPGSCTPGMPSPWASSTGAVTMRNTRTPRNKHANTRNWPASADPISSASIARSSTARGRQTRPSARSTRCCPRTRIPRCCYSVLGC